MYPKWRGFCGTLTLAASLMFLGGCGSTSLTYVRVVNASPGPTGFTVQVGQTGVASGLPYGTEGVQPKGQYSTIDNTGAYREIGAANNQRVTVYTTPGSSPLTTATHSFPKNTYATIVTLSPQPAIQLQILTDVNTAPPSGEYRLRFMDASPRAGAIDVYITAPGGSVVGATPVIGNINFQGVVSNPQPSPGTLEIQITPQGNQATVLATLPFAPASGQNYSVFFLDPPNSGSGTYGLLVVNDPIPSGKM